jgi:hypothetical protein
MAAENLAKWEGKMTAGERCVLTTTWVAKAMKKCMDDDRMRLDASGGQAVSLSLQKRIFLKYDQTPRSCVKSCCSQLC